MDLGSLELFSFPPSNQFLGDGKIRSQAENLSTLLGNLYLCLMSDDVYQYSPEGIFRLLDDDIHFPLRLEVVHLTSHFIQVAHFTNIFWRAANYD